MKKQRLFVAINLPEEAREKLKEFQEQWRDFPARWVKPENIHLTLSFLGYVEAENTIAIIDTIKTTAREFHPLSFVLSATAYGPSQSNPRMIWVKLDEKDELVKLQQRLNRELLGLPFRIHQENRPFSPHLTVCRFNSFDLKGWSGNELPDVQTKIGERVEVKTVELMESKLKRGGAEYSVLQSVKLC